MSYVVTLGVGKECIMQYTIARIVHDLSVLANEIGKYGPEDVYHLTIIGDEGTLLDASPCYFCEPCASCNRRGRRETT